MKSPLILLCIPLILGGCNGETSPLEDSTRVALQPNITTAATSRSIVNGIGTGDDQISTISIYVTRAADNTAYPGAPAAAVFSAPATAGQPWTTTPTFYVNATEGRLYACSPSNLTVTGNAPEAPTVPVSIPATQNFDGASTIACSTVDYLYGSASNTPGQADAISVSSTANTPAINLQHALSRIIFTIKYAPSRPSDDQYDFVKSVSLDGTNLFRAGDGTMQLNDGTLSLTACSKLSFKATATPQLPGKNGTPTPVAYGLVAPKPVTTDNTVTLSLVLGEELNDNNNRTLSVTPKDFFNQAWEKGRFYTYNLVLDASKVTIESVTINKWNEGNKGENPTEMPPSIE